MRQHRCVVGNQVRSESAQSLISFDVFAVNGKAFVDELSPYRINRKSFAASVIEGPAHSLYRPEQIHRRRARHRESVANEMKVTVEVVERCGFGVSHPKRDAHRRGDADCGRASNNHVLDSFCDFVMSLEYWIKLVGWKPPLIDHYDAFVGPLDGSNHGRKDNIE
jgi:hypothetical protein